MACLQNQFIQLTRSPEREEMHCARGEPLANGQNGLRRRLCRTRHPEVSTRDDGSTLFSADRPSCLHLALVRPIGALATVDKTGLLYWLHLIAPSRWVAAHIHRHVHTDHLFTSAQLPPRTGPGIFHPTQHVCNLLQALHLDSSANRSMCWTIDDVAIRDASTTQFRVQTVLKAVHLDRHQCAIYRRRCAGGQGFPAATSQSSELSPGAALGQTTGKLLDTAASSAVVVPHN